MRELQAKLDRERWRPILWKAALTLALVCTVGRTSLASSTNAGAFATGQYRNLFVEAGHSPAETKARINRAFQQLFHGNPQTQSVYFPAGRNENGDLAYLCDIAHNDVRSEGMSYGMIIAVQLDKQAEFDALWNWSKTFMQHTRRDHPAAGFFSWSVKTNGVPNDEMPAPDGEEYFVTALYFATHRWGNGKGIFHYQNEANQLLTDMRHRQPITGKAMGRTMTAGGLFHPGQRMVRFTPEVTNWDHTDPSYHLPAFYELWARWGPEGDRAFWQEAAVASREFFKRSAHPVTALTPDYANFDGSPWTAEWQKQSGDFHSDAWRSAMNWSVDWAWWAKDLHAAERSDRLQAFFEAKGLATYGNKFTLDGRQTGSDHSTGLVAMNAVASLAATHPRSRNFVEALWTTPIPSGTYRYYDGLLYLFGLLHCSGEFRIWSPK